MSDDNQYKFNEDILNILSRHPNDQYEVGARGWICPDSNLQHSSWAIFLNKPWKSGVAESFKEEVKATESLVRSYCESGTTVYSLMSDTMQEWSKQGLTEYRDAINEVLALWEDLDEQEAKNNTEELPKRISPKNGDEKSLEQYIRAMGLLLEAPFASTVKMEIDVENPVRIVQEIIENYENNNE